MFCSFLSVFKSWAVTSAFATESIFNVGIASMKGMLAAVSVEPLRLSRFNERQVERILR